MQELNAAACNIPVCTPQLRKRSSAAQALEGEKWSPHSAAKDGKNAINTYKIVTGRSLYVYM